ncbi:MAG: hypothetical protein ACIAQZ_11955 [Sedimentisphaeraceae bacterium JB056]
MFRNFKKYISIIAAFVAVLTPVIANAYTGEDPNALETYNRVNDFAAASHTEGTNDHGLWSYHMMTKAEIDAYGRGDTDYWTACDYLNSVSGYRFYNALPKFASLGAYSDHLEGMWNKSSNDDLDYRESEIAAVFTAPEDGSYNLVGDLKWSNELLTDPRAYVHIGVVEAGSGIYTNLWSSDMLRGPGGDYTQMIDPANPEAVPGFTNNAALENIPLFAGDQLLIILQTGLLNYRKTNIHDSEVYVERFEMGPLAEYNRMIDWTNDTHTLGETGHGLWSYHMIKGTDEETYGRGDSAYWVDMPYLSTDKYQFTEPLPAYWYSGAMNDRLQVMWNKSDNDHLDYIASEGAIVFEVPETGEYSVAGGLKWSTWGATDARAYVHIGTIKAGQNIYSNLWSSVQLRDADNLSPYEAISPDSPVEVPGFADNSLLQNIPLSAGDKIMISVETGLNYRGVYLHDDGLFIQQWPSSETIEFNRGLDMGVSTKSGNSHGTTFDPSGGAWQYWIKRQALDKLDYLPGELEAFNWDSTAGYFGESGPSFLTYADTSMFTAYWNRYPDGGVNYNPLGTEPWVVATFKNPYNATVDFNILGATTWEKLNVSDTNGQGMLLEISKINADFTTKTVLWSYEPVEGAIGVYDVPDPALYAIDLADGEYIAIAMRGNRLNHRKVNWYNSELVISADPESFYNLTVEASPAIVDSGVSPMIGASKVVMDQEIEISAVDFAGACPTGYSFDHWEVDGVLYSDQADTTLVVDADMTLTAVFVSSNECGDVCRPYPVGDVSFDCVVDLEDFAKVAQDWTDCTDPSCD